VHLIQLVLLAVCKAAQCMELKSQKLRNKNKLDYLSVHRLRNL
jgi:hypothetical protein